MIEHEPSVPHQWDIETDVVVAGFGAAGFAASVTAHDLGAKVLILEKAPEGQHGGNTRVAGQGYLNTSSADKAAAYLRALCGPYAVPEPMVQVWAEEMCRNNDWLASLGGDPQEHQHQPVGIEFPDLPGADCDHKFHDCPTYGYSYTWKLFERLVKERPIPILYETPARELIQHDVTKEILGVRAQRGEKLIYVKARRAVVLTCGGQADPFRPWHHANKPGLKYYNTGEGYPQGLSRTLTPQEDTEACQSGAEQRQTGRFRNSPRNVTKTVIFGKQLVRHFRILHALTDLFGDVSADSRRQSCVPLQVGPKGSNLLSCCASAEPALVALQGGPWGSRGPKGRSGTPMF
jgi:FAD binding domain-containing protein